MTQTEYEQKIDPLIAERDALWSQYDAVVATHGLWSGEAGAALVRAGDAEDAVQTAAREYLREMES